MKQSGFTSSAGVWRSRDQVIVVPPRILQSIKVKTRNLKNLKFLELEFVETRFFVETD